MKHILITGASGYIGKALMARLRPLNPVGIRFRSGAQADNPGLVQADLREEETVLRLFDQYHPDAVFHLAGLVSPAENEKQPQRARELHVGITSNILKYADGETHLVFPSTDKVFDGSSPDPDEDTPARPQGLYGKLKLECEQMIRSRASRHHIFRLPIVHGMGDPHSSSFVDKALIELEAGRTVEVFQNVERCFVKLDELVDVLESSITDTHYGTYHVGSKMMTYYDRVRALCNEKGVGCETKLLPRTGHTLQLAQNLSTRIIQTVLGWSFS